MDAQQNRTERHLHVDGCVHGSIVARLFVVVVSNGGAFVDVWVGAHVHDGAPPLGAHLGHVAHDLRLLNQALSRQARLREVYHWSQSVTHIGFVVQEHGVHLKVCLALPHVVHAVQRRTGTGRTRSSCHMFYSSSFRAFIHTTWILSFFFISFPLLFILSLLLYSENSAFPLMFFVSVGGHPWLGATQPLTERPMLAALRCHLRQKEAMYKMSAFHHNHPQTSLSNGYWLAT